MKKHMIVQRWFKTGEGWAYDSEFPESIRQEVVAQIAVYVRQFQGKEIRQCLELGAWKLHIIILKDNECLDPGAVRRNPHIDIGILLPKSQKEEEIVVRDLELQARKICRCGTFEPNPSEVSSFPLWRAGCVVFFLLLGVILNGWRGSPKTQNVPELSVPVPVPSNNPKTEPVVHPPKDLVPPVDVKKVDVKKVDVKKVDVKKVDVKKVDVKKVDVKKVDVKKVDAKKVAQEQLDELKTKYGDMIKDWKFGKIESIEDLITKVNWAVGLRQGLNLQNSHPDVQFLVQCFPEDVIHQFDEKNATKENFDSLIVQIVKAFRVSEFRKIGDRLNFDKFCGGYQPDMAKIETIQKKVYDFNVEFSQPSNDTAIENVRFLMNCQPELEQTAFYNEDSDRPYFAAWMILLKIKPNITYEEAKSILDSTNTAKFIREISNLNPEWVFKSKNKEDFKKELKGILEVWLRLEKRAGKGTQK